MARIDQRGRRVGVVAPPLPQVVPIEWARHAWSAVSIECYTCGSTNECAVHEDADPSTLECVSCGHLTGVETGEIAGEDE